MALTIAREFFLEWKKDETKPKRKVLLIERGTWWTTPVGTVADKEIGTYTKLKKKHGEPVQFWSSNNSFRGVIDLLTRCMHNPKKNPDGLYQLTRFGTVGLFKQVKPGPEQLVVLRANGVGGGSLVYSNITEQPPDLIFNDERWLAIPGWSILKKDYYEAAGKAIGLGILHALKWWDENHPLPRNYTPFQIDIIKKSPDLQKPVNNGLSQIVTRSAGINPHWKQIKDVTTGNWGIVKKANNENVYQLDGQRANTPIPPTGIGDIPAGTLPPFDDKRDFNNDVWVDRARIFHRTVAAIADSNTELSANTLSINDYDTLSMQIQGSSQPGNNLYDKTGKAGNYCERQGRCNIGCLPGARHTLNKQLMAAVYGPVKYKKENGQLVKEGDGHFALEDTVGIFNDFLKIEALCEVDYINELDNSSGYEVIGWKYAEQNKNQANSKTAIKFSAARVVVAAGCLGTNEIMLRSKQKGNLKNLSAKLGSGFSTNGDNFFLLGQTKERIRSTRGPVQTSHAHFNLNDPGNGPTNELFHMIEDLGIPPAFATTFGFGRKLVFQLANGQSNIIVAACAILRFGLKTIGKFFRSLRLNRLERQAIFENEDEISSNFLALTSTGREQAKATIRLGGSGETPLRIERLNSSNQPEAFINDPVYQNIRETLNKFSDHLADANAQDPNDKIFLPLGGDTIGCSHPLGGCAIGKDADSGVVDEFGHVYDISKGKYGIYQGLYIADASVIPTALGVNPSLSITAVCWHIANNIRKEII